VARIPELSSRNNRPTENEKVITQQSASHRVLVRTHDTVYVTRIT
jgi:hypothetical protein